MSGFDPTSSRTDRLPESGRRLFRWIMVDMCGDMRLLQGLDPIFFPLDQIPFSDQSYDGQKATFQNPKPKSKIQVSESMTEGFRHEIHDNKVYSLVFQQDFV